MCEYLQKLLYIAEEAKRHAESIDDLKKRWENIQRTLVEIRNTMNLLEDKENFYRNAEALQKELDDVHAWNDKMLAEKPSNNLLIHLRNRIRTVRQLEMKLKELNAQAIVLLSKPQPAPQRLQLRERADLLGQRLRQLLQRLGEREAGARRALGQPAPLERDFRALQAALQPMEAQIIAEHAMVSGRDRMTDKIQQLTKLREQFDELQSTYDRVVKDRRENCEKGSVQELNFRSSLENLVTKFGDTKTILDQKINKLEKGEGLCVLAMNTVLSNND